jgi:hypothetical protein
MALTVDQAGPQQRGPISSLKRLLGIGSNSFDSSSTDFPIPRHKEIHLLSILSTPLISGAIAEQARTVEAAAGIARDGEEDIINLLSKLFSLLYRPLTATHPKSENEIKIIPDGTEDIEAVADRVQVKTGKPGLKAALSRILHPAVVRNITNLNFANYNIFSNMLIKSSNESESSYLDFFYNILKRPLMFFSSGIASGFSMIGSLLASSFAFLGEQKFHDASKFFASLSKAFEPLAVGLGAYNRSKLSFDRFKNAPEMTMRAALDERGISWLDVIQGKIGTYVSILNFPNMFLNFFRDLSKRDREGNLELPKHAKNLTTAVVLSAQSKGYLQNYNAHKMGDKVEAAAARAHLDASDFFKSLSRQAAGNPIFKPFMRLFMPVDHNGDIYFPSDEVLDKYGDYKATVERLGLNKILVNGREVNTIFGTIPKAEFLDDLNGFLDPVQRVLMHMPAAVEGWRDPYIQDNGNALMRTIDTLVGFAGITLAFPSFLIYSLSSRLPQLILNGYKVKQRIMERKVDSGKFQSEEERTYCKTYNAMNDLRRLVHRLENPSKFLSIANIPGARFVANVLKRSILDRPDMQDVFFDITKMNDLTKEINAYAERQEETVKVPSFIRSIRGGIKQLMAKYSIFRVFRGEDGLTTRERSRQKTYNTLENFQGVAERFPIIGSWVIGPFIGLLKSAFKVKSTRKPSLVNPSPTSSPNPSSSTNPIQTAIANLLNPKAA